jgi:hypothetical protein
MLLEKLCEEGLAHWDSDPKRTFAEVKALYERAIKVAGSGSGDSQPQHAQKTAHPGEPGAGPGRNPRSPGSAPKDVGGVR